MSLGPLIVGDIEFDADHLIYWRSFRSFAVQSMSQLPLFGVAVTFLSLDGNWITCSYPDFLTGTLQRAQNASNAVLNSYFPVMVWLPRWLLHSVLVHLLVKLNFSMINCTFIHFLTYNIFRIDCAEQVVGCKKIASSYDFVNPSSTWVLWLFCLKTDWHATNNAPFG